MFLDTVKHYGQCIYEIYKIKFNIYQINAIISFRFLKINFGEGTSCHDPYRNMRINTNSPQLIVKPRIKEPIPTGSNKSYSIYSKKDRKERIRFIRGMPDWPTYFLYS